jgi:proline dehydrogenase
MVDFEDTKTAFVTKSDSQLKKAFWLFKFVANQKMVSFGKWSSAMAMKVGLPIKGLVKSTVYDQFVGGETIEDCARTVAELKSYGVYSILDYSVEGARSENALENTAQRIIETIHFGAKQEGVPFAVFKMTGVVRFGLLEKLNKNKVLSEAENKEYIRAIKRVEKICQEAHDAGLSIFIDAEETWVQESIDRMCEDMMEKFNKKKCVVFTTLQMYRWDRLEYLKDLYNMAVDGDYLVGVKLVRGAYMEKERERAYHMGYESPIQPDKEATDRDYDEAVKYCIEHADRISVIAGSHNEESAQKLADLMLKNGLAKNDKRVWFSQLYGMSDNLSFNLAKEGYNTVKYLPFGPVEETLPYLIRRAEENTSAAGQTSRELNLIKKEMDRRGLE